MIFLGCCCRYSGGSPQSPDCWSYSNVWGKIGDFEVDNDRGMVKEV